MFGIGTWELIVILVLGLIILGPTKFPEVAKSIGKGLASLRKSVEEVKQEIDLDGLKSEIEEEAGLDELKQALDVRGDIRRAIDDLQDPPPLPDDQEDPYPEPVSGAKNPEGEPPGDDGQDGNKIA